MKSNPAHLKIQMNKKIDIKNIFIVTFIVTCIFKMYLAAALPITGDEALFYVWGKDLTWGYYDHPPMIAWILWLLSNFSHALLVIRLPAILLNHLVVLGIIHLIIKYDPHLKEKAYQLGLIYLLLPISLLSVFITNDISLTLFSCLSIYFFLKGELFKTENILKAKDSLINYALAGIFTGCAFLSKYLVVVLAFTYFLILVKNKRYLQLLILIIFALPFGLMNLAWNLEHCWQNIVFNTVNRADNFVAPWIGLPEYFLSMAYVLTPLFCKYLWDKRRDFVKYGTLSVLAFLPPLLFAILSLKQIIGLHWLPPMIPPFMILGGLIFTSEKLIKIRQWVMYILGVHLIVLALVLYLPMSTWEGRNFYDKLSLLKDSQKVAQIVQKDMHPDSILMTMGYSTAANFAYQLDTRVPVFGEGGKFARHDDLNFDFRNLDGKNIRIFDNDPINPEDYKQFFNHVELVPFTFNKVNYWYMDGSGFKYSVYREQVLKKIAQKYYVIPKYLPKCQCEFFTKYELENIQ